MGKVFKRTLALILVMLMTLTSVPLSGLAAEGDVESGLSSVATVQPTAYGVLDTDVSAVKVTLGSGYSLNSHKVDYEYQWDNYGEGFVLVEDEAGTTFYLVGIRGVIRSFYSDSGEKPRINLLQSYSMDNPYALYRVYNPETKKYDLYNANTCQYYEYALDEIAFFSQSGYHYEYVKGLLEVKKDGKYGLINNKGQMLYSPMYESIFPYENALTGSYRDETGRLLYAVLSNKGLTSGTKGYDDIKAYDNRLFAVSDVEPNETWDTSDYMDWALLNPDLTLMTDFIYSGVAIAKSGSSYYRVCSTHYEEKDYYGEWESLYQHQIISDTGNSWNVCEKFNCTSSTIGIYNSSISICKDGLKIYITDDFGYYDRNGTGWVDSSLVRPNFTQRYILAKPNGEVISDVSATDDTAKAVRDKWSAVKGIYGKCEYREERVNSEYVESLYDSKGNVISTITLSKMSVMGDYLVYNNTSNPDESFIYNYVTEEMVLDHIYIDGVDVKSNGVCFADSQGSGKWAIFDTTTGEYTNYLVTATNLRVSHRGFITNGVRKLWICSGDGHLMYVNDKGVVLSTAYYDDGEGCILQSGDYLIKCISEEWGYYEDTYEVEIIDYDGKVKVAFDRKVSGSYTEADAYITCDASGNNYGLMSQSGTTLIDNIVEGVGNCYNGLSFVVDGDFAAVVDNGGNALIGGEFDIRDLNHSFVTVGVSGFASFVKGNEVYIYDFTACHGFDENTDSSVVTEDDLFGEYHAFLNNGFYNSLTHTAGVQVATALSHYGENARAIAFVKSALDGQTGYVIEKLVDFIPGSSINESKAKQEMALEYLNSLDTETTSKYLQTLSTAKEIASIINDATKLDYTLNDGKSKLQFVKRWTEGTGYTSSEIYKVIDEAKKYQDRFDAYFKQTGRTIYLMQYVSSYLTIYMLQRDLIKSLMDMIPQNSDLYEGLNYIYAKQSKSGTVVNLVKEMVSDEILSVVADLADKGLMKLANVKNANIATLILYVGCKIASKTIDSPMLEDIDKAVLAYANMITLKTAVNNYQQKIAKNYSQGSSIPVDTLKAEYSLLCDTYYKSIFTALSYAEAIALDSEKTIIAKHTDNFEKKLIYRSYIKTCLLNARTQWEYTVQANKAVITKLKAAYPSGEGRVPYMELYNASFNEGDEMDKRAYPFEYAIDVPTTIDGYEVGAVGSASFSDDHRVTGIYVPDSVTQIQNGAFKNCSQINTVYLGDGVETIGDNAFENCHDLGYVDIPDSVTAIGEDSFTGVNDLLITGSDQDLLSDILSDNVTTQTRDVIATDLEIITPAAQTELAMQEEIDTTGLTVRVTYTDGTNKVVDDGFYAEIVDRVVGENIVVVSCEGLMVTYPVTILEGLCDYAILYQDEQGNTLADSVNGTAMAGSTLTITAPAIAGYIPAANTQTAVIGYRNVFVVTYMEEPKTSIADATVTVKDQKFANSYLTPTVKVKLDGKTLTEDQDYTISYADNFYVGTAMVIVVGMGDYEGMLTADFTITETEHSWSQWYIYYEPYGNYPGVKYRYCVGCGEEEYKEYVDENHKHTYQSTTKNPTCTADGSKKYTCFCGHSYSEKIAKLGHTYKKVITKATASKDGKIKNVCTKCGYTSSKVTTIYKASKVSLSKTSYTYNGKVQKPSVAVKDSKGKTISSSNYTVKYASGLKNAGTYKVTITFKGNYSGTKTLTYKINPISVSKCKISLSTTSYTYNGSAKKPSVTVKNHAGTKLTTSSYTVTYASGRKNVGTYKVTIKMKGNYSGTKTLTFKINPAKTSISKLTGAKKSLKVAITKKSTQVTGYQIQYSTSKSFKSYKTKTLSSYKTTSTTLTGLSAKKTYYVRVRTYKTVSGKKYYSGWSTIKYTKTK